LNKLVDNYFDKSYKKLVSFFAKDENISKKDLEEMKKMIEEEIKKSKD